MGLFLKQTEQRTQLQEQIDADLRGRLQTQQLGPDAQQGEPPVKEEATAATGRSLFWVGLVAMVVVAIVLFVLFVGEKV